MIDAQNKFDLCKVMLTVFGALLKSSAQALFAKPEATLLDSHPYLLFSTTDSCDQDAGGVRR